MAPKKNNANGNEAAAGTTGDDTNTMTPAEMKPWVPLFELKGKKNVMQRFNRLCTKLGFFKAEPAAGADGPSTPGGAPAAPTKKKNTGGRRKKKNAVTAPATVTTPDKERSKSGRLAGIQTTKTASNGWCDLKNKIKPAFEQLMIAYLNEREFMLACLAWQCLKNDIKSDFLMLVELRVSKTVKRASNIWSGLKQKFIQESTWSGSSMAQA
ncbi:hypothetical protein PG994_005098 [Apiospora phragmitis]|uniref:Uncharacterized protein n=1 Tax=Apiospora phragmitis TaxID=2905665 RepID=A0ABR1VSF7_9PEZI